MTVVVDTSERGVSVVTQDRTLSVETSSRGVVVSMLSGPGPAGTNGADGADGVDGTLIGSYVKGPVTCATLRNITLSGHQIVDAIQTTTNMRVLAWRQDAPATNGIYLAQSGAWTRATDCDSAAETAGAMVICYSGDANRAKVFRVRQNITTLGTDALLWDEETQGGSPMQEAARTRGTLVTLGDSNTSGRTAFWYGLQAEFRHERAPFATWTHYNHGVSGYTLNGLLSTMISGDKNAAPVDSNPVAGTGTWDGNIWRVVNANPNLITMSIGINDMNAPAARSTYGSPTNFPINLDASIYFLLTALPRCSIVLITPQPYVGEDFTVGSFNTDWAADSSDGTIDTNAAYRSSLIRAAYLAWTNRHPRVAVWDSAELFGTSCNDKAVNSQDPEGQGALLDDSLHYSALAGRRITQYLARFLGFPNKRVDTNSAISNITLNNDVYWGRWFNYTGLSNNGADSLITIRGSQEHVFLQAALSSRRTANLLMPKHVIDDAEIAYRIGDMGFMRGILGLTRDIKLYFPTSGNTYTIPGVALSVAQTNGDGTREFVTRLTSILLGGLEATSGLAFIYTTSEQGVPFLRRSADFSIDGTGGGGGVHNPYPVDWIPTTFSFQRGIGTNQIDVKIYAEGGASDGRLVDAAVPGSPHAAPGAIVAEATLNNGIYNSDSMTLNATNWPSGFLFKSTYRLVGRVTSGTMIGLGSFRIRG